MIKEKLKEAMGWLANQPRTIFLGQNICYPTNQMYNSLLGVPDNKKIEMPITEDMQMGLSIGLALENFVPITIYPRFDFLLAATNQLANHLDKMKHLTSNSKIYTKIIIRTMVGGTSPLDPGPQHSQDYVEAYRKMLKHITIIELIKEENILSTYKYAYTSRQSVIVVEKW